MLVDEDTVEKYKADLSEEIEPQITELISRAEKGIKVLQKKHYALQTKVRQIFLYVPWCFVSSQSTVQVEAAHSRPQSRPAPGGVNRRLQMLVKQSERLEVQLRELESEILTMVSCVSSICRTISYIYCHEGSISETTVDLTGNIVSS